MSEPTPQLEANPHDCALNSGRLLLQAHELLPTTREMTIMTRARAIAGALLGVLLTVPTARAQAQNAVITGKVTSEFGQPMEGVNVYITELSLSVGTNAQGAYTITIPAARIRGQQVVLRARSFGFIPQMKPLTVRAGSQSFDFVLRQDVNRLQEVVVTGVTAGTEQKKLPFTVAHVGDQDMPVPGANPLSQLQGKMPGVNISSTSGRPGAEQSVLLRGPQSINGSGRSQGPLYIVDGIVISGGLPDINPQDIESVEVVKGAAASSLYGSRAGNGVIQITTRTGKNAGEGVHFSAREEYGQGDIEKEYPYARDQFMTMNETGTRFCVKTSAAASSVATCARTIDFQLEALRVNELGGDYALSPANFERDGGISATLNKALLRGLFSNQYWPVSYDPIAASVTPGANVNSTFDAQGRMGGTNFFASVNNFKQQGAIRFLDGYIRNSLRLNLDQNVGEDWTFGLRTYYSASVDNGSWQEDGGTAFFRLTRVPAGVNLLATDKYGRLYIRSNPLSQGGQNQNPLYIFQNQLSRNKRGRFLSDATAKWTPTSWADLDANVSFDRTNTDFTGLYDKGYRSTSADPINTGYLSQSWGNTSAYNGSVNGSLHHTFLDDLNARLTGRYLYEQQDDGSQNANGYSLAAAGLQTLNAVSDPTTIGISSSSQSIRSIGMMTGIDADYHDRYIANALFRRDGSSLFGSANRWANYGRGSVAWIISEEPWWFAPALNNLKLRYSVGTAGGRPSFAAQYEAFSIGAGGALSRSTLGNKNLRPETVTETEIGADAELLSRYGLTVNYARSTSKDQILPVPPPAASGASTIWINAGTLENKTWEASLNVPILHKRNLNYSMRFNYDRNRAYITQLDVPEFFGGPNQQGATSLFKYAVGERYGTMYGRAFVTDCSQLPSSFASDCGAGKSFQKNSDGWIVWTGGKNIGQGITNNYWQSALQGCVSATGKAITTNGDLACKATAGSVMAPWGVTVNWGMPIIQRDSTGTALQVPLGNALPNYRISTAQNFNYKKLYLYGLFEGTYGRSVWNEGRQWSLGDYQLHEIDQVGKSVADAKPMGYYWRAPNPDNGNGVGGLYDILGPNNNTVEDASYVKLRELNVSYNVGAVRGIGDWTVSAIGRNLHTWTKYKGFDPEVGFGGGTSGSSGINALDAYTFPNLRTLTFALGTKF